VQSVGLKLLRERYMDYSSVVRNFIAELDIRLRGEPKFDAVDFAVEQMYIP